MARAYPNCFVIPDSVELYKAATKWLFAIEMTMTLEGRCDFNVCVAGCWYLALSENLRTPYGTCRAWASATYTIRAWESAPLSALHCAKPRR